VEKTIPSGSCNDPLLCCIIVQLSREMIRLASLKAFDGNGLYIHGKSVSVCACLAQSI